MARYHFFEEMTLEKVSQMEGTASIKGHRVKNELHELKRKMASVDSGESK